jgi:DnaK suppressor protein
MTKADLTEDQIEEMRGALEAEKDAVEEELSSYGRVQDENGTWAGTSDSEGSEADPTDAADNIEQLVTNMPLVEELEGRHREILVAIERMEEGEYGICEVCKQPIDFDRLEANPAAATCVAHA